MAVIAMVAAAASAHAVSGGVGPGGTSPERQTRGGEQPSGSGCQRAELGDRALKLGDCGTDVKTLHWVLKSKRLGRGVPLHKSFKQPTDGTVRAFQRRKGLRVNGVVGKRTHRKLARSMRRDRASWYGPGFWGNQTACGQRLRHRTVGVAHKRLPCGTKVTFKKGGRFLRTKVIDRGPFVRGLQWDLTRAAARKLGITQTESLRSAIIRR